MTGKDKGSWLVAALLALFFFATSIHISLIRPLWFDELGTLRIAKLPDLATVWQVQQTFLADSAPIVYHLLVRVLFNLSGHFDLIARYLSALAMIAAMLVAFDCARRLAAGIAGLVAFGVLGCSFLTLYGFEGRPYALAVLFTSTALWLWLHTDGKSKMAALAFGVSIFLAVGMHFNSVLAMVPFGVWELYRWRPWQRPSSKLVAGTVGIICSLALSLPQMRGSARWIANYWCPPSIHALMTVWGEIFPSGLFILGAFAILASLFRAQANPMDDAEKLCWLFLTIPFAGFVIAELATHAFYNRYLITVLPGVAIAFGCMATRYLMKPALVAFLVFLCGAAIWPQIATARRAKDIEPPSAPDSQARTQEALASEDAVMADGKRMIITHFLIMEQARYYSKHPGLYRMYETDAAELFCKCFETACMNTDSVKSHATEMAAVYPSDQLIEDMRRAGIQSTIRMTNPLIVYFSPASKPNQ
jgi:hypothetical protein